MAPYPENGSLTTDKRTVDDTETWDSQEEWEAYQSADNVEIVNGTVQLAEITGPPDEGSLHAWYDWTEEDGSMPVTDQTTNGYDLVDGDYSGVTESINGVQAGAFDGTDDELSGPTFSDIRPATVHAVARLDSTSGWGNLHNVGAVGDELLDFRWDDAGNWSVWDGSAIAGSSDSAVMLFTIVYGASGDITIRESGAQTGSGNADGRSFSGIIIGDTDPNVDTRHWTGAVGEWLVYPSERTTTEIEEAESYLASKWGITL